jgi:ABC-type branched-subunit amino acid transport system substrate-binding protein
MTITRRQFLWTSVLAGLATSRSLARAAEPRLILIGHLRPPGEGSAARGALLGAEESVRAAELLGARFELRVREVTDAGDAAAATREAAALVEAGAVALVSALDAPGRAALGELAVARRIPLLTTRAPGDLAEDEPVRTHVFHVSSSPRDRRETLARWKAGEGAPPGEARIEDWHPSLERFGATQLNQRYRERFGSPMDSLAWASWFAVKAAAETALRNAVERIGTSGFDGHKGVRLRFRPDDHVLRQPLYVVAGERVLTELSPKEENEG